MDVFFQEQTWQTLSKSLNSVIEVTTQQNKMATLVTWWRWTLLQTMDMQHGRHIQGNPLLMIHDMKSLKYPWWVQWSYHEAGKAQLDTLISGLQK